MHQKLSKYTTAFDYIDKILIVLSAKANGVTIIAITSVVGTPVGIASAFSIYILSLMTRIIKKLLNLTRDKKKKNKTLMLAKSKLHSIENFVSQCCC